jgi:hypothetical protein
MHRELFHADTRELKTLQLYLTKWREFSYFEYPSNEASRIATCGLSARGRLEYIALVAQDLADL